MRNCRNPCFYRGRHSASAWGNLAGVHNVLGDLAELDIRCCEARRSTPKAWSAVIRSTLDQDALGLADDLP